jgi:hypothetical protein
MIARHAGAQGRAVTDLGVIGRLAFGADDLPRVGSKGRSESRSTRVGGLVPAGFYVTTAAYARLGIVRPNGVAVRAGACQLADAAAMRAPRTGGTTLTIG